jgi:hypothetical protein
MKPLFFIALTLGSYSANAVENYPTDYKNQPSRFFSSRIFSENTLEDQSLSGLAEKYENDFSVRQDGKRGIWVGAKVTDQLSGSMYFLSRRSREYKTELPLAFTSYQINKALRLRAGRLPYPLKIYNDFRDLGYIYPSNSTPRLTTFAPMQTIQGIDFQYSFSTGSVLHDLKGYLGSACDDYTFSDGTFGLLSSEAWGFSYEPKWNRNRLSVAYHQGETDFSMSDVISMYEGISTYSNIAPLSYLPGLAQYIDPEDELSLLSLGGRMDFDSLYLLGEYNQLRWDNEYEPQRRRLHLMIGGDVTENLQLYTSYEQVNDSLLYREAEDRPTGIALSASYQFDELLTGVRTIVEGDSALTGLFMSWDVSQLFNVKAHFNYLDSSVGDDNSLVRLSIDSLF